MVLHIDRLPGRGESRQAVGAGIPRRAALSARLLRYAGPLASLELTIISLASLMLLVALCTLSQAKLGLYAAVDTYIHSLLVWGEVPGTSWRVPVFPGGALVGFALFLNLVTAQFLRLEWSRRKAGLWLVHLGLALLFAGEFASGLLQQDGRMALREGARGAWVESARDLELAVIDATDPSADTVYAVAETALSPGASLSNPGWPFTLLLERFVRVPQSKEDPPEAAGSVEARASGAALGKWSLSSALADTGSFEAGGRRWRLALRHRRRYLPFSLTLKKFRRELHPGTDIPRHFSSLVHLSDPARREDRDVLISMNRPLRYGGQAFYQASFDSDGASILHVSRNPGWLIPYLSCILVGIGMLVHFAGRFWGRT